MSILYLDEAGNSGINDANQPFLIYGGVCPDSSNWKQIHSDIVSLQQKYTSLLLSRISLVKDSSKISEMAASLDFFKKFHFHARDIINRTGMWSKLGRKNGEHFALLEELIDVIVNNDVKVYIGALKKSSIQNPAPELEYKLLLPSFFKHIDNENGENHFMVIWDDGNNHEKLHILDALGSPDLSNCIPELVSAKNLPMLQLSDAAIWIVQSYLKLEKDRKSDFTENVKRIYAKLDPQISMYKHGF